MLSVINVAPLAPYAISLIATGAVLAVIAVWLIFCAVIANNVLKKATKPVAHTLDEVRKIQAETEHTDIDAYENKWLRTPFEIDGLHGKLRGEVIDNPADNGNRRKVAIIVHGHTMNRINSVKYAAVFYNLGFSAVIYDHSYFGQSDGQFCTLGYYERHDLSAVIDFTKQRFGNDSVIALHGESMGAVTALTVLGLRNDVDMVIADCPFSDTFNYYCELFTHLTKLPSFPVVEISGRIAKRKYGYDFLKCCPIADVAHTDVPVCFIHGLADDYIYPHHSQDMYKVCQNPLSELHLVPNARHACSHLTDREAYTQIVGGFVNKIMENNIKE